MQRFRLFISFGLGGAEERTEFFGEKTGFISFDVLVDDLGQEFDNRFIGFLRVSTALRAKLLVMNRSGVEFSSRAQG